MDEQPFSEPSGVAIVGVAAWGPANLPDIIISDEPTGLIAKLRWRFWRWRFRLRYGNRVKTWTEAYGPPGIYPTIAEPDGLVVVTIPMGASAVTPCSVCGGTDYNGFTVTWREDNSPVVVGRCCGGCE